MLGQARPGGVTGRSPSGGGLNVTRVERESMQSKRSAQSQEPCCTADLSQPARQSAPSGWRRTVGRLPHSLRAGSRFLAALCLALLCVLAAPTAAQAQTTVWSATLTAKAVSAGNGCQNGSGSSSSRCSTSTTLSEDEFSYDGHDYAISGIRETASGLQIAFTGTIATGASQSLVFMVDGAPSHLETAR